MDNKELALSSPTKKRVRRPISVEEKQVVANIYKTLIANNPTYTVTKLTEMTAQASGLAISSVYKVMKEHKTGEMAPPKNKGGRPSIMKKLDEEAKSYIRRKVDSLLLQNELPSVDKVKAALDAEDNIVPKLSRTSLYKVLKEMGVKFKGSHTLQEHTNTEDFEDPLVHVKQEHVQEHVETQEHLITVKQEIAAVEDPLSNSSNFLPDFLSTLTEDPISVKQEPEYVYIKQETQPSQCTSENLESRILDPLSCRTSIENRQNNQELTARENLDYVDLMFLDFAKMFKEFSSKRQLAVKTRICQIMSQAEMEEIEERQRNA